MQPWHMELLHMDELEQYDRALDEKRKAAVDSQRRRR